MVLVTTLIISTQNAHKVQEFRALLGASFRCLTLRDFPGIPPAVEDAPDFAGNASRKAVHLARWLQGRPAALSARLGTEIGKLYSVADDSGLEVDILHGAPGVHSARFAALDSGRSGNSSDAENNAKLLHLLANVPAGERRARFRCVIALTPVLVDTAENASPVCYADETELSTELFDGACEGRVDMSPRGTHGFGYDPLFIPDGFEQSFAELGDEVKNRISHRAKALEKLQARFLRNASNRLGA